MVQGTTEMRGADPPPFDQCLSLPCFVKMLCILLYLSKALGNVGHQLHLHTCTGVLLPSLRGNLLH